MQYKWLPILSIRVILYGLIMNEWISLSCTGDYSWLNIFFFSTDQKKISLGWEGERIVVEIVISIDSIESFYMTERYFCWLREVFHLALKGMFHLTFLLWRHFKTFKGIFHGNFISIKIYKIYLKGANRLLTDGIFTKDHTIGSYWFASKHA